MTDNSVCSGRVCEGAMACPCQSVKTVKQTTNNAVKSHMKPRFRFILTAKVVISYQNEVKNNNKNA